VIELEHEQIRLAAIDTRMRQEVLDHQLVLLGTNPLVASMDESVVVFLVVRVPLTVAFTTLRLSPVGRALETIEFL
jgi:hypothetical protein